MSMPGPGQSAERDERGRDDYEQQQARVLMALMQGFCAARYRKADNTPCPIEQVSLAAPSFAVSNSICFLRFFALCSDPDMDYALALTILVPDVGILYLVHRSPSFCGFLRK